MSAELYIQELQREKDVLDQVEFQHAIRLLEREIQTIETNNNEHYEASVDQGGVYKEEVVKLSEKIVLPVNENPRFNFVGKIIGPKGSTMKALQSITKTRILILGKGSTRDREQEEQFALSDDPKHEHFKEPLHVVINVRAPRSVAHERVATAIEEINKCLQADSEGVYQADIEERARLTKDEHTRPVVKETMEFRTQPAPIIKVGIPPPGAIILNRPAVINGNPPPRSNGQGRGGSPVRGRGSSRPRPY